MFWDSKRVLVTGGEGFLGKALVKALFKKGIRPQNILIPVFPKDDLRNYETCLRFTAGVSLVIHLAAKVGGIYFNQKYPGSILHDNLLMGVHLMEASRVNQVQKAVFIGTTCSYPRNAPVPLREETIWDGYPAEVTAPYGLAKKILHELSLAYRKEYGFNSIFLIPVNLYGPQDNFTNEDSHVIPALIKRFFNAATANLPSVTVWGSGKATREFLYVDDAAEGILDAAERYDCSEAVNLGTGIETPIRELVGVISDLTGYQGKVIWDNSKPDGTPRRCVDVSKAWTYFHFGAKTDLKTGLIKTIHWYKNEGSA